MFVSWQADGNCHTLPGLGQAFIATNSSIFGYASETCAGAASKQMQYSSACVSGYGGGGGANVPHIVIVIVELVAGATTSGSSGARMLHSASSRQRRLVTRELPGGLIAHCCVVRCIPATHRCRCCRPLSLSTRVQHAKPTH
jgi:hypothetical protein